MPQGQGHGPRGLGGELQPPARGQGQARDLADDAGQPAMPQPFLHRQQHRPVAAGLGIDHPIGMQAGAGEARGEQAGCGERPQHRPAEPRQDPGREQRGRRLVGGTAVAARHLVQRAESEAALGQGAVERFEAERQRSGAVLPLACLEVADAPAEIG